MRHRKTRVAVAMAAVAMIALTCCSKADQRQQGADLFEGRTPLQGRLNGHATQLPPQATRCINCHGSSGAEATPPFGGQLDARSLTLVRSRRNGPESRFDARSLCRLLRTGVDAAEVMVSPVMPRYELSDVECSALWQHLSST